MNRIALLLAFLALPAVADEAKKKVSTPPSGMEDNEVVSRSICRRDKDERILQVIPKEKGCVLHYTKEGKTEEKAHATHGVKVCQDTLEKIQKVLENASFQCE